MFHYQTSQIRYFKNYLLIFVVGFWISSCAKEEALSVQNALVIDTSLQPYFARFEEEATSRGLRIDLADAKIEGEIVSIEEKNVVGQCTYSLNGGTKTLRIDKTYWSKASTMEREFVVFHELGHCYLERVHTDVRDASGNCVSIMHSGLGGCQFRYNSLNRKAYLDELFEQ